MQIIKRALYTKELCKAMQTGALRLFRTMAAEEACPEPAIAKLGKRDPKSVTDEEWKQVLTPEVYEVTRKAGTEPAGKGIYTRTFVSGKYICTCCGSELFVSGAKFWSSCGWPAFAESVEEDKNIVRIQDNSYGMERVEVRCKVCNAHLGHVFDEESAPKGERYCINSCSIKLIPDNA